MDIKLMLPSLTLDQAGFPICSPFRPIKQRRIQVQISRSPIAGPGRLSSSIAPGKTSQLLHEYMPALA